MAAATPDLFASHTRETLVRVFRRLPPPRNRSIVVEIEAPKQSALLVPLVETDDGLGVVLTRRAASMTHHRDDWVFPGGRLEPDDDSAAGAAVREASEELGIPRSKIQLLGQLDRRGPIVTGYVIDVFVALLGSAPPKHPRTNEVAEVQTVLLSRLAAPGNAFRAPMDPSHDPGPKVGGRRPEPAVHGQLLHFSLRAGEHLWGLQADILAEVIGHLDARAAARLPGVDTGRSEASRNDERRE